jgi:thiaminase/transcriptional activator TenA
MSQFRFYIRQDYLFLIEYCKVLAMTITKAPSLQAMTYFAELLHDTLHIEMSLHREYCARLGISAKELEETKAAPTTKAYTGFLLNTGYAGSFSEVIASLLPCQVGYAEIGAHLAHNGEPKNAPLYAEWVRMYSSREFQTLAKRLKELANELASKGGRQEQNRMLTAYLSAARYEYQFWEMSYNGEDWAISLP